jgi:hypothetical protein
MTPHPETPATESTPERADSQIQGATTTITCDELYEFVDDLSQPANAWPWPEPPFVKSTPQEPGT